jgi:hypothetical protein
LSYHVARALLIAMLCLVHASSVFAAAITPYAGQRFGSSFSSDSDANVDLSNDSTAGFSFNWDYGPDAEGEVVVSISEQVLEIDQGNALYEIPTDVSYFHFGGRLWFNQDKPIQTSVSGGIGASYFDSKDNAFDGELKASMHLALGARYRISESIAIRGDIRVFGTFFDSAYRIRCIDGACLIEMNSEFYTQTEVVLGLEYRF